MDELKEYKERTLSLIKDNIEEIYKVIRNNKSYFENKNLSLQIRTFYN